MVGGPPCHGFSQVRNHARLIDDPKKSLYREFVQLVGHLKAERPGTTVHVADSAPVLDDSWAAPPGIHRRMQLQRERDTAPEVRLREELHRHGLRYRLDQPIVAGTRRRRVDIVFSGPPVAVIVDGCFWHGCPEHGQRVHDINGWYWPGKIAGNRERDSDTDRRLAEAGWRLIRAWGHDNVEAVASRTEAAVRGIADTGGRR